LHMRTSREWASNTYEATGVLVRRLLRVRGIGANSAWLYVMEFFGWRQFRNRREVGGLAGLTPTPYQSGELSREQGIGKAGNRYIRAMAIEIAWGWLRFQPESALSRWYQERFGQGSSRIRRIGIVALAGRLLVELWRYLETGAEHPAAAGEGAALLPPPQRPLCLPLSVKHYPLPVNKRDSLGTGH